MSIYLVAGAAPRFGLTASFTTPPFPALPDLSDRSVWSGGFVRSFASEQERVHALGMDTATGRFRPNEAETAVRIEAALGVRLTRAPRWSRADWFDQTGTSYDAVGPFAAGRFEQQWRRFSQQILLHLHKAELVPVDVSLFTPAQVETIEQFIASRRLAPRVFTLGR